MSNAAVSLFDLYPTLLDLTGLPAYDANEGAKLKSIVNGDDDGSGCYAMTSCGFANYAIRGERYRYIRFVDGSEELNDHQADPNEWTNLADDPAYAGVHSVTNSSSFSSRPSTP